MIKTVSGKIVDAVSTVSTLFYKPASREPGLGDRTSGTVPGMSDLAHMHILLSEDMEVVCGEPKPKPTPGSAEEVDILARTFCVLSLSQMMEFSKLLAFIFQAGIHGNSS
jgi:hypothetical protein